MLIALALTACTMQDNSLESATLSVDSGGGESGIEVTGVLTATPGIADGDWALTIATTTLSYHSPSHADLGSLSGETFTVMTQSSCCATTGLTIADTSGPVFIENSGTSWDGGAGEDGSTAFGHAVWTRGSAIGRGVVTQLVDGVDEEAQKVKFTDVVVTSDDGETTILPGEPTTVLIDGASFRFTVLAAYLAVNRPHMKCGAPDMLAVELIRTGDDPGPVIVRPAGLYGPVGMCG